MINSVNGVRASGMYPVVSLELFEKIYDLKIDDFVLEREESIKKDYQKYIDGLFEMKSHDRKAFLNAAKRSEIRDNSMLEEEDPFFTELYNEDLTKGGIDILLRERRKMLSKEKFVEAHKILLDGHYESKFKRKYCRVDNSRFVGSVVNGERNVQYFPIDYRDAEKAMDEILLLYNSRHYDQHLLIKPQILHGLIAASQIFEDGNTRFARVVQNVKIFDHTVRHINSKLETPAVYGTRAYFPYRDDYRNLIYEIVKNNDDTSWNNWFKFNLNRFEDSLWMLEDKKGTYERVLKRQYQSK